MLTYLRYNLDYMVLRYEMMNWFLTILKRRHFFLLKFLKTLDFGVKHFLIGKKY